MRLIDADALNPKFVHGRWDDRYVPEKEVQDAPTVEPIKVGDVCKECWRDGGNVVEVVRCKDCKNWDTTWQNDWAKNYHYCPLIDGTRNGDWYCADGERRSEPAEGDGRCSEN